MQQSLFVAKSVTAFLDASVARARARGAEVNFARVAEAARISPSYLSKVRAGRAHLSADQLHLVGAALGWNDDELVYAEFLGERARSGLKARQKRLDARIEEIRRKHLDLERHLEGKARAPTGPASAGRGQAFSRYHADPLAALVHVAMTLPRIRARPERLVELLGLSRTRLEGLLSVLEEERVLERTPAGWRVGQEAIHLPRSSPSFLPWAMGMRQAAASRQLGKGDPDAVLYTVTFTADRPARDAMQARLLELLKACEKASVHAEEKEMYQLNIDLFTWIAED